MKSLLIPVLLACSALTAGADLPDFVKEATAARKAANGVWHITPQRIVWTSEKGVEGSEHLLVPGPGQAVLGQPNPICSIETGGSIVLDFGAEIQGGIEVFTAIQKDQTPVPIRVRFGESVSEVMASIGDKGATNDHAIRDESVLLPWLGKKRIGTTGFRFVRIDVLGKGRQALIPEIRAVLEVRDLPYLGSFRCSDDRLNRIWDVGAWTVHLNMQDYLWDGIKRDRLVWVGDMHPEWRTISTVFGANDVVPKSLDLISEITAPDEWMNGISSYSMWWIIIQEEWFRRWNDHAYLERHADYLEALLLKLTGMVDENGSEILNGHRFMDWPSSENPEAVHAGLQALMVWSMESGARMMRSLNRDGTAQHCEQTAEALRKHVPGVNGSKQAAALLALTGLANPERIHEDVIQPGGVKGISTFYGYYVLEAMAAAGEHERALDVIRDYWGAMLDLGATTFWEDFNIEWVPNAAGITELVPEGRKDIHGDFGAYCYENFRHSLCHGWASGPTPWMSRHVLGIEVLSPDSVRIDPNLGDLDWAEGSVPMQSGLVKVRAERGKDPIIQLPPDVQRSE